MPEDQNASQASAEAALQEREAMYRQAIATAEGVVYQLDFRRNAYIHVEDSIERLIGYTVEEMTPVLWSKIGVVLNLRGELAGLDIREASRRFRAGEIAVWTADYLCVSRQGDMRCLSDSSVPLRDEQGEVTGCLGILQDITERYRAQMALRDSEERFRQMAENIQEIFWIADTVEKRVLYVNPAYEKIVGRTCQSLCDRLESYVELVIPEDRPRVLAALARQRRGEATDEEYRIRHPDGTVRWIRDRGFPIRSEEGEVYRAVGIAADITERRHLEEQLLQAQKMEGLGRLAGGIAHDFNNILTAIIGFTDMAQEFTEPDSPVRDFLDNVLVSAERAAELTRQLLAVARKQIIVPKVLNLNDQILETEKMLRRLIGEHITLRTRPHPDLGMVKADPGQMQQVLVNLAVNARDAMPSGGTLTLATDNAVLPPEMARRFPDLPPGDYVTLIVQDTGQGIPPDVQGRIFEPFFTTKEMGKGTGMGLATCYGIIKQNRGHIKVESAPGDGTTFTIYLPRVEGTAETKRRAPRSAARRGAETLLLAEDEPMVRDFAKRALEAKGYTVLAAENGPEALRLAEAHAGEIHLLITDIVMPVMSGIELATALRRERPETRVLYLSGFTEDALLQHEALAMRVAFLHKPFTSAALARKVRETLNTPRPAS